jgi:hypothetical protein
MPIMDGFEAIKLIHQMHERKEESKALNTSSPSSNEIL